MRGTSAGRTARERAWFFGGLGVALVPFAVSAVTLLVADRGYHSYGDLALTEAQLRSVGRHFPLVGVYSTHHWFHPGPMLFYLFAGPYRLFGGRSVSMMLTALLSNALAVVAIAYVARRRAGIVFAVLVLAGTALLAHALGPTITRSPWNPLVLVIPMVLFVLLAWCVAEGDVAMLPWAALTASFEVQSHVGTLAPVVAVGLTVVVLLILRRSAARDERKQTLRRWVLLAASAVVLVWLPPLVDALLHGGGNARHLYRYFRGTQARTTLGAGIKTVAGQLTLPPPWFRGDPLPFDPVSNLYRVPHAPIPWLGVALVGATFVAYRRGERAAARFGILVVASLVAAVAAFSRVPDALAVWFVSWVPALGMLAGVATVWAVWCVLAARGSVSSSVRRVAVALGVSALVVPSVLGSISATDSSRVQDLSRARAIARLAPPTLAALSDVRGPVLVRYRGLLFVQPAFVVLIEQHGGDAVVPAADAWLYPTTAHLGRRRPAAVLTVVSQSAMPTFRPAPDERLVAGRIVPPGRPIPRNLTQAQFLELERRALARTPDFAVFLRRVT